MRFCILSRHIVIVCFDIFRVIIVTSENFEILPTFWWISSSIWLYVLERGSWVSPLESLINHSILWFLFLFTTICFITFHNWLLPRKICSNPSRILSFIWQFSESGYQHGTLLESLLHADVFRLLFDIVCFGTLVSRCYFRKFVRILPSMCGIFGHFTLFSRKVVVSVQ